MRDDLVRCVLVSEDGRTRWEGWGKTEATARQDARKVLKRSGYTGSTAGSFEKLNMPKSQRVK